MWSRHGHLRSGACGSTLYRTGHQAQGRGSGDPADGEGAVVKPSVINAVLNNAMAKPGLMYRPGQLQGRNHWPECCFQRDAQQPCRDHHEPRSGSRCLAGIRYLDRHGGQHLQGVAG